ncbi:aspartate/glutamate racemase family protein [Phreatobacter aquaticus]|uniref:Hydantoin racemase n=1 Tax=Phreatobacter aquaticus TaxID=2570229 RepID=A0A4D7QQG6_9HYPH|nr:aspartate/glutamate racemase family protein [Phreatobacter aquaticus]QCK88223.1 aspartate/glutamate racemase family protein [Phreatobacter aquaticus]
MHVTVINPNTTASMTRAIGEAARAAAAAGTTIVATNPDSGPASIEGYYDEVFSIPGLIAEMKKARGTDAFVIACFDDTGLDGARSLADVPVIGIGEAAMHMATLVATRFSVITTLKVSVPALEHNVRKYGFDARCGRVRACEVPVLALEDPASGARAKISSEIVRAKDEDGAEAIVLGCAGMAELAASLTREHGLPVIDGVASAVKLAEAMIGLGLKTSKVGGYAPPRAKAYAGTFAWAAP